MNFSLDSVLGILSENSFLADKYMTAVGKTEWEAIKWTGSSIAEKKDVINSVDWVFTALARAGDWETSRTKLRGAGVNSHLLDCSDAHYFSDSANKDRIGNCFTWIKADPTFDGLRMACLEYDERVYVGDSPDKLRAIAAHPNKYIASIGISRKPDAPIVEQWFGGESLELNSGLVAIIGNKGSGKSALADVLGLLGSTANHDGFEFLNENRFRRHGDDKSRHFTATLTWLSGAAIARDLNAEIDDADIETVKYIPQGLFEDICSEIPGGEESEFDREIKRVIFSRLPQEERRGKHDLDSLVEFLTEETRNRIHILEGDLTKINRQVIGLQEKNTREYRDRLAGNIKMKVEELALHEAARPQKAMATFAPTEAMLTLTDELANRQARFGELEEKITQLETGLTACRLFQSYVGRLLERVEYFDGIYTRFVADSTAELFALGVALDEVVTFSIDRGPLEARARELDSQESEIRALLDPMTPGGPAEELQSVAEQISLIKSKLDEPARLQEQQSRAESVWETKRAQILGDSNSPDTLIYFEQAQEELKSVETDLAAAIANRREIARAIHALLVDLSMRLKELYKPVQAFIDSHPIAKDQLALNFDVSIVEDGFRTDFFDWINRQRTGSFRGMEEGARLLQTIIARFAFDDPEGALAFVDSVMLHLQCDMRHSPAVAMRIEDQLKTGKRLQTLYDYIFSMRYLKPRYVLRMGAKDLSQLSPGEKGALLLVFYLLIDKSLDPLVIDQPEHNLDNQTVYQLLVAAIREAKKVRQVIIVTHNPNLAVVCDAEQIICSSMDKQIGNRIAYTSGSIENNQINRQIVDILEGTRPAFDNRKLKYYATE